MGDYGWIYRWEENSKVSSRRGREIGENTTQALKCRRLSRVDVSFANTCNVFESGSSTKYTVHS